MSQAVQMPSWGSIFKAQLRRTLGTRRHVGWALLALITIQIVVLATTGLVFGINLAKESSDAGGTTIASPAGVSSFADFGFGSQLDQGLAALWLAGVASLLWAAFWPGWVWSGETSSNRDYHWAMPIRPRNHDLTRVLAGGTWLALICAALILVAVISASISGNADLFSRLTLWFWINLLVAPLLIYTLASIVYVRAKARPFTWFWGGVLSLGVLLNLLAELAPGAISSVVRPVASGTFGVIRILFFPLFTEIMGISATPGPSQLVGWLLWATLLGAGLWIAASVRPNS